MTNKVFSHSGKTVIPTNDSATDDFVLLLAEDQDGRATTVMLRGPYAAALRATKLNTDDALLSAVESGKAISGGMLWQGAKMIIDRAKAEIKALSTPLSAGRTLTAEETQQSIRLGEVWDGLAKLGKSLDAERSESSGASLPADVERALQRAKAGRDELEALENKLGEQWQTKRPIADSAPTAVRTVADIEAAAARMWKR